MGIAQQGTPHTQANVSYSNWTPIGGNAADKNTKILKIMHYVTSYIVWLSNHFYTAIKQLFEDLVLFQHAWVTVKNCATIAPRMRHSFDKLGRNLPWGCVSKFLNYEEVIKKFHCHLKFNVKCDSVQVKIYNIEKINNLYCFHEQKAYSEQFYLY